jgi:hypothetical protein
MANAYGNSNNESTRETSNISGMASNMADNVTEMASNFTDKMDEMNMSWGRVLSIGSFVAAGICFFTGRRPAGFALASIGVATLAAEHPEKFQEIWNNMPDYMERGTKIVEQVGGFMDKLNEHGAKFQQLKQMATGNGEQRPDYVT